MRTKALLFSLFMLTALWLRAQQTSPVVFDQFFADSTLRIDYVFAGNQKHANIYVDELNRLNGWYGRRQHLDSLLLEGNGSIIVCDKASGQVIYKNAFSTLFQEWLSTDEAAQTSRGFENVFLVPYPKKPVSVTVLLTDMKRDTITTFTHEVNPKDILIHDRKPVTEPQTQSLLHSGDPRKCIDIVIMAEGYTQQEKETFMADAKRAADALIAAEPFKSLKQSFNITAVFTPSAESGVSVPRQDRWIHTAFGSHFDTFYSDRYLTSREIKRINNALIGVPYEHIIMLANTDVYGGGGIFNSFTLTAAHHSLFAPVVVHEFGHSFGGLADEYFYDNDVMTDTYDRTKEPWEQNVTNLIDFKGKKWSALISANTPTPTAVADSTKHPVGLYEGAAYSKKGFYRASYDCRMRTNTASGFCPACTLALRQLIQFYTGEPAKEKQQAKRTKRSK